MSAFVRGLHFFAGFFLLAAVLAVAPAARAADDEPEDEEETVSVEPLATDIFRHELFRKDIRPLRNVSDVRDEPHRTIIILLGERSVLQLRNPDLRRAVERGAALLVASDQSSAGSMLGQHFGVEITGELVDAAPDDCYKGRAYYPFVFTLGKFQARPNGSPGKIFQPLDSSGAGALVTNNPSIIHIDRNHLARPEALAGYPLSAHRPNNPNDKYDADTEFFAAGGDFGDGRYLVLADHSIFLNSMVWRPEVNSNLFFAQDCIGWLQGEEKKDRCLFIEEGEVKTKFELEVPERPLDWFKKFLMTKAVIENHGNDIVTEQQERNSFNEVATRFIGYRPILRFFVIALTAAMLLYGLLLLVRGRTGADPARTLVTPELAVMIPRGNVLRQRFDAQLDVENVYEAARQLVRDFLGGMDAEPDVHGLPPKLLVEDGYLDEAGLRRRIARLWRIGFDGVPVKVTPGEWGDLTHDLQEVLNDADDGWWKFVPANKKEKEMERG